MEGSTVAEVSKLKLQMASVAAALGYLRYARSS